LSILPPCGCGGMLSALVSASSRFFSSEVFSDMPQPLNRVVKTPTLLRFTDEAHAERPELAMLAMTLIAAWSRVDLNSSYIFALSIDAQHERAAKLLNACESAGARLSLIRTAIQDRLGDDALALYSEIIKGATAAKNARNDFAHNLWAYCKNLPDALLLVDARYFAEFGAGAADRHSKRRAEGLPPTLSAKPIDHGRVDVYRKPELESLIAQARKTSRALKLVQALFPNLGDLTVEQVRTLLQKDHLI